MLKLTAFTILFLALSTVATLSANKDSAHLPEGSEHEPLPEMDDSNPWDRRYANSIENDVGDEYWPWEQHHGLDL
ncbi:hypothetical protein BKA62DRAFT_724126 [Auriculariales sp. MPI-PUGE-AT-0066]|nr:hypothetical protein BKA62DRAFT_724126 [Auriculariales sp. MPI-PUGE-AT-0066]